MLRERGHGHEDHRDFWFGEYCARDGQRSNFRIFVTLGPEIACSRRSPAIYKEIAAFYILMREGILAGEREGILDRRSAGIIALFDAIFWSRVVGLFNFLN